MIKKIVISSMLLAVSIACSAENGYDLWLRYIKVSDPVLTNSYRASVRQLIFPGSSAKLDAARRELNMGLSGLLQSDPANVSKITVNGTLVIGTTQTLPLLAQVIASEELRNAGTEGYLMKTKIIDGKQCIIIAANTDVGVLYGVFNFLKLIQTHRSIGQLDISDKPKIKFRLLNHWDNLDGTIEHGFGGYSLWDWQRLPGFLDKRYTDYARANASIGINGTVLNNVNSNAQSLSNNYLVKTAGLAGVFRRYGIKVYLSARFTAPMELGKLKTADPLDPEVRKWWKDKADEIYRLIPDFGGFMVKANSEGQPGPQDYHRTHADGANMLAQAVAPHGGIVIWRAFVYANAPGADRAKQAYEEFKPLDGKFDSNVVVQVKNGPIDFQPREPAHPLFGAMPKTNIGLEFEIIQEYLGFATHLVYLAPLFKECLDFDTHAKGNGSTIAKIVDGSLDDHSLTVISGVSNIGSDLNWCGHPFGQANWYAFGRLAWNPKATAEDIADDWLRMTYTNNAKFIEPVKQMMLGSREATVNYMMPLGLYHIFRLAHHFGPGPWDKRAGWNQWETHQSDSLGIGYDRTHTGTNAVAQYFPPLSNEFDDINTCPEKYLLFFHHVAWDHQMRSGKTLWNELVDHYYSGVDYVSGMRKTWSKVGPLIDSQRYDDVKQLLIQQEKEAVWWRDACVLYFQTFSKRPIPAKYPRPEHPLAYYQEITFI